MKNLDDHSWFTVSSSSGKRLALHAFFFLWIALLVFCVIQPIRLRVIQPAALPLARYRHAVACDI